MKTKMPLDFSRRHPGPELMDHFDSTDPILAVTIQEIAFINKYLGGNKVTLSAIRSIFQNNNFQKIHVADLGCGNGDQLLLIYNHLRKQITNVEATGIDANGYIINQASVKHKLTPLQFRHINVFDQEFSDLKFDLVHCTLFLHHLTNHEIVRLLVVLSNKTKMIIINDLHRNPLAYWSIRLLTTLFSSSFMVRNDAPLSVLRGFKRKELEDLFNQAGINNYRIRWKWAFRWQIIIYTKS